jgi:hypothetical protein
METLPTTVGKQEFGILRSRQLSASKNSEFFVPDNCRQRKNSEFFVPDNCRQGRSWISLLPTTVG